jgi:SSS family solute:Na+ symporter
MGMVGMAWSAGTPAFWWLGAGAAGLTVLAIFLAAKVRESGSYTMPEMVEKLLGPHARSLVSVIIVVAWMGILAAQFSALGKLVASLAGVSALPCLGIAFVLIVGHTLGGQAVVMRTDRLQFYILAGGIGILLYWLSANNPGWTGGVRIEAVNARFGVSDLLHCLFVVGGNYLVCPMLFGRFLSARDSGAARRGGLLAGLGLSLCGALIVAVGLACRGLVAADTPPDAVLTAALDTAFPRWLAVLVLIALVSAVVSSADSCLVTAATVLGYDLLRTEKVGVCRLCVVGLGVVGALLTFMEKDILGFLFMAYDIYVAGVVMPVFIAILFSRGHVARRGFALAAIAVGGVLGGLAALMGEPAYSLAGMGVSTLLAVAGVVKRRA